jgi:hypothetical protein
MQRSLTWLTVVLAASALVAGCGSSSSTTSSQSTSGPAATGSQSATSTSGTSSAIAQLAVAACKQRIQTQAALTTVEKSKLEAICNRAANGNPAARRKVAQEVCTEIVNKAAAPGSPVTPAREQALAACKNAR